MSIVQFYWGGSNHGLGKKIIERIMSRHGGLLHTEAGEDSYRVTLAIPLSA